MSHACTLTLVLALSVAGCASPPRSPYAPLTDGDRDSRRAHELTRHAADLMDTEPEEAERLLREALTFDLFHGPAHNNLGVRYLEQNRLYDAANEFEWACKLMPGHPDPRLNLAVTLERAGRIDDALETYGTALEIYPDHLPTLQALCRCQLRHGRADGRTPGLLEKISLRGETEQWRAWAQRQLMRLRHTSTTLAVSEHG